MARLAAGVPVPTPRLAAVAALGALVVLAAPDPGAALIAVNAVLLGAAAGDWWLAPRPATLGVTREAPAALVLDGEGEVRWRVRNPTSRPLRVRLADALAPSLRAGDRRARLVVPPQGTASAVTAIRPGRRGRFRLGPVTLRVEGPLGLAARQATVEVAGRLQVAPPFRSRREADLRIERNRVLHAGLRPVAARGGGTEFDSLREYAVDDDFRHIDWSATARFREPIVRTYRAERNQTVLVMVDCGRTMAGRLALPSESGAGADQTVPRLDAAMDAAMMLTAVGTALGDRVGMVAFAERVRAVVAPGGGTTQLRRVTEALAPLHPVLAESDYQGAFVEALTRFRRRALLVVLTELSEQPVGLTLLPALPMLLRHHLVVVAAARDPEVELWAGAVPADARAAFRKAAAVRELAERRRVASGLRSRGVVVVDALPSRLGPEVTDAYLRVKAAARL